MSKDQYFRLGEAVKGLKGNFNENAALLNQYIEALSENDRNADLLVGDITQGTWISKDRFHQFVRENNLEYGTKFDTIEQQNFYSR